MIEYTVTKKVVEAETPTHACCDICEKEIKNKDIYYEAIRGHYDWGAESGDSVKNFHICSEDCLKKMMDCYISSSSRGKNTEFIEIYHSIMNIEEL